MENKNKFFVGFRYLSILFVYLMGLTTIVATGGSDKEDEIPRRYYDVPIADIIIDGESDDWTDITPALTDQEGDSYSSYTGTDVKSLYVAQSNDLSKVYVMMELWDGPPNPDFASSYTTDGDTENPNVAQGYSVGFVEETCTLQGEPWPCLGIGASYDTVDSKWLFIIDSVLSGDRELIDSDTVQAYIQAVDVIEWELPISLLKSPHESVDFHGEVTSSALPSVPKQTGGRDTIWEFNTANRILVLRFN